MALSFYTYYFLFAKFTRLIMERNTIFLEVFIMTNKEIIMVKLKVFITFAAFIESLICMWIGNGALMFVTCLTGIVSCYIALNDPNFDEYYDSLSED